MNKEEKDREKNRVIFQKGGIHSSEYTYIAHARRVERWLRKTFFENLVWVTVKGERRLGRVQKTHMEFIKINPITGFPIFECDVFGMASKKIARLNSEKYNIELDGEIPDELTYEEIMEYAKSN